MAGTEHVTEKWLKIEALSFDDVIMKLRSISNRFKIGKEEKALPYLLLSTG